MKKTDWQFGYLLGLTCIIVAMNGADYAVNCATIWGLVSLGLVLVVASIWVRIKGK